MLGGSMLHSGQGLYDLRGWVYSLLMAVHSVPNAQVAGSEGHVLLLIEGTANPIGYWSPFQSRTIFQNRALYYRTYNTSLDGD